MRAQEQPQEQIQEQALDVTASAWVAASAGSGKTTLLVSRVLRLLLTEVKGTPQRLPKILCLTYTRAAAAEMQNRVHAELSLWASLPNDALWDRLREKHDTRLDKAGIGAARTLFAQVLEKPELVRIMTMHAFCQLILNRFPLEAGIAPGFTLLEGKAQATHEKEVLAAFYARMKKDADLASAFQRLAATQRSQSTEALLLGIFHAGGKWQAFCRNHPTFETYQQYLRHMLGLAEDASLEKAAHAFCSLDDEEERTLKIIAEVLQNGSKTEAERGAVMAEWLHADDAMRKEGLEIYLDCFLTKEGEPRARLFTKDTAKNYPTIEMAMEDEQQRALDYTLHRAALLFYAQQNDFSRCGMALFRLMEAWKARHAALTYDDLIAHTKKLLLDPAVSAWVLYKLDGGMDHVLIDEAQDTSPQQWQVVLSLLEEFLAGEGARGGARRTLFVVGDEKQSIYSFQGASRNTYLAHHESLQQRMEAAKKAFYTLDRNRSFRSAPAILDFVDAVFADAKARQGVAQKELRHSAARAQTHGYVELWPTLFGEEMPKPEPWQPPLQREDIQSAPIQLAERVAGTIARWLKEGYWLASEGRPVQAGDIMILLQRRSLLLAPLVRALKDAAVPVVGVDRMVLRDQGAVQDVLALCRFLLLPQDDLTLAEVLRSPFIRLSDEELFALAHGRNATLWEALQTAAETRFGVCAVYLKGLLSVTDLLSPFALLNKILFEPCPADARSGQHALMHRLGFDALDPLEELLSAALQHEITEVPALQFFVQSISRERKEIKREMSKPSGQVRILTVHGAKGLEAPIVFVPDLMSDPQRNGVNDPVLWNEAGAPLHLGGANQHVPMVEAAKEQARHMRAEENRRLLYVALTRARDVLILCSAANKPEKENAKERPLALWQDFCAKAFARLPAQIDSSFYGDSILRFGDVRALTRQEQARVARQEAAVEMPGWALQQAEIETAPRIVIPSRLQEEAAGKLETVEPPFVRAGKDSYLRGRLLHRLLQMLPNIAPEKQEAMATQFLAHQWGVSTEAVANDVAEVMAVLRHKDFAELFGVAAQAEVAVAGILNGKKVSGQIDRLLVTGDAVLIVDFKTNRPPPLRAEDVPQAYLAQMAAYAGLLEQIYPGKAVRTALLWTHLPLLMPLDACLLQRGLTIIEHSPLK